MRLRKITYTEQSYFCVSQRSPTPLHTKTSFRRLHSTIPALRRSLLDTTDIRGNDRAKLKISQALTRITAK